ncbi:unnamed protein product, partial [Ectocarpus sp. 13 AM-2016]
MDLGFEAASSGSGAGGEVDSSVVAGEVVNWKGVGNEAEGESKMLHDHGTGKSPLAASYEQRSSGGDLIRQRQHANDHAFVRSAELAAAAAAAAAAVEVEIELPLKTVVEARREFDAQKQQRGRQQQQQSHPAAGAAEEHQESGTLLVMERDDGGGAPGQSSRRASPPTCPPPGPGVSPAGEAGGKRARAGCGESNISSKTFVGGSTAAAAAAATEMFQQQVEIGDVGFGEGVPHDESGRGGPRASAVVDVSSSSSSSSSSSRRGGGGDEPKENLPPSTALVDVLHEGSVVGVESISDSTAAAAVASSARLSSPEAGRPFDHHLLGGRPDILPFTGRVGGGGGGSSSSGPSRAGDMGSSRDYGGMIGPVSPLSQALHMALAFVVLVLVAIAKADDVTAVRATPYAKGAGYSGSGSNSGSSGAPGSTPARRKGSRTGGGSGSVDSSQRSSGSGPVKRRRIASSSGKEKIGRRRGGGVLSSPVARHLRAAWSSLWHAVEDDLATRWRAAGRVLTRLRQAWSALWV